MMIEYYLPSSIISNENLQEEFPTWESEKAEDKIGISRRHIADENETALDLGEKAAIKLLENYDRKKIDFLLFCTQSPDYFLPTSACILQDRLQLSNNIGALDYNLGCSGYVYGLALAKGILLANLANNVLLVVAETYSKHVYKKDIANRVIFGDGAAATIISKDSLFKIGEFTLGTDGKGFENLITRNGAFKNKLEEAPEVIQYGTQSSYTNNNLYMNGPEIFNFTIDKIPSLIIDTLKKNNLDINDIDYFIFHQANKYILNYLRRKIKIAKEKFYINMSETGNTVSATIPIALKGSLNKGRIKNGNKVMLVGFGVGYSWGATIITI